MMTAFATISDLEARWRKMGDPHEKVKAEVLLGDASAFLIAEHNRLNKTIDSQDKSQSDMLKIVCCSMVKRVLASSPSGLTDGFGDFSQLSKTTGPFNEQWTLANPSGDMYLTSGERAFLSLPKRKIRIGSIAAKTKLDKGGAS